MKIKRLKLKSLVSCGVGAVLPANPARPDVTFDWHQHGVLMYNMRTKETILTPWSNIVEVVVEEVEPEVEPEVEEKPKKRGRRARAE